MPSRNVLTSFPLPCTCNSLRGPGSNRAKSNDNGLTSADVVLSAGVHGWWLAWLPMRLVGVLEVGFHGDAGVRG